MSSTFNTKVYCRQSLTGGNYGLLKTTTFAPNPDYYRRHTKKIYDNVHHNIHIDPINKRGDSVDEKVNKLDIELARYKEQIKKTRPGPAQEAIKARAMRILKHKRMAILRRA